MPGNTTTCAVALAATLSLFATRPAFGQSGTTLPTADRKALSNAMQKALPPGATGIDVLLPIDLGPLGQVRVVQFRLGDTDSLFRGLVMIPDSNDAGKWRASMLPEEQEVAGNYEEITTAVLGADIASPDPGASVPGGAQQGLAQSLPPGSSTPSTGSHASAGPLPSTTSGLSSAPRGQRTEGSQRALVVLFRAHQFGETDSTPLGRVYIYQGDSFHIDNIRSRLLDGIATAAQARKRLAPVP